MQLIPPRGKRGRRRGGGLVKVFRRTCKDLGRSLEGLRKASGKALEGSWKALGRSLEGLGKGLVKALEGSWKVLRRSSEGLGKA